MAVEAVTKIALGSLAYLVFCLCFFVFFSHYFEYEIEWLARPNVSLVALMMTMGIAYLIFVIALLRRDIIKLGTILFIGIVIRLLFLSSTPVYEDDFYRYFWDGELSTQGLNPYAYAPIEFSPSLFSDDDLLQLESLFTAVEEIPEDKNRQNKATEVSNDKYNHLASLEYLDRVAYPSIRTIYPPLSQLIFFLSQQFDSGNLFLWRVVLLLFDCVTCYLLFVLLKTIGQRSTYLAIYWLNPLVIVQTMGAAHMDVMLLPFLLAAALYSIRKKFTLSGLLLAAGVGIKLWPILLAPFIFRPLLKKPKSLMLSALPFLCLSLLFVTPQLVTRFNHEAGLVAYATSWNMNALLFPLIEAGFRSVSEFDLFGDFDPALLARLTVVLVVLSTIIYCLHQYSNAPRDLTKSILVTSAVLLLMSPTAYPWYFLWILPWLAIQPNLGLLLLTVTLPLYYLRYMLEAQGMQDYFNGFVVPLEFMPVFVLLVYIAFKAPKNRENLVEP